MTVWSEKVPFAMKSLDQSTVFFEASGRMAKTTPVEAQLVVFWGA
jgi:hypothetical protein